MTMSQNRIRWSFLVGIFLSPLLVSLILSPHVFDYFFPNTAPGFKAIVLILLVLTVLWSMLQSAKEAMYITSWAIVLSTFFTAFEIDRLIPASATFVLAPSPTVVPVLAQLVIPNPTVVKKNLHPQPMATKRIDKSNDTLQFSSFDSKEKTPVPTPTATPNLTPFLDISRWTEKNQSIGSLPDSAFFGKNGSSSMSGITNYFKAVYQAVYNKIFGR